MVRTLVKQVFEGAQDPSIHFYQEFVEEYDPQIRRNRGVYYTPDVVVDYIVRTVDHLLRTRFNLRLGLADPITWGKFGGPIPAGADAGEHVVQILDPATGTGTFLLHSLQLIFETMRAEYKRLEYDDETAARAWVAYVRSDLLPRINGFELMMAPYIVAHLRLGLALASGLAEENGLDVGRWGFRFAPDDRLRVFLTNTLELNTRPQIMALGEHVATRPGRPSSSRRSGPYSWCLATRPTTGWRPASTSRSRDSSSTRSPGARATTACSPTSSMSPASTRSSATTRASIISTSTSGAGRRAPSHPYSPAAHVFEADQQEARPAHQLQYDQAH